MVLRLLAAASLVLLLGVTSPISQWSCVSRNDYKAPHSHLLSTKRNVLVSSQGYPLLYQENTLDGILYALNMKGIDGVHFDVGSLGDETPVVFADTSLNRMVGSTKMLSDMKQSALNIINLKTWAVYNQQTVNYQTSRRIPSLREVLSAVTAVAQDKMIFIELRPGVPYYESSLVRYLDDRLVRAVASMISEYSLQNRVVVISADPLKLFQFKVISSGVPTMPIINDMWFNKSDLVVSTLRFIREARVCLQNDTEKATIVDKGLLNTDFLLQLLGSLGAIYDRSAISSASYLKEIKSNFGNLSGQPFVGMASLFAIGADTGTVSIDKQLVLTSQTLPIIYFTPNVPNISNYLGRQVSTACYPQFSLFLTVIIVVISRSFF